MGAPSKSSCSPRRAATARASTAPCRRSSARSSCYGAPVYVRKEIVHNKHVVEQLRERGAVFVESETEVPEGATVVFSAHGVAPSVHANAAERRLHTIDATCPLVTKVHVEAKKFAAEGYTIVLDRPRGPRGGRGHDGRGARQHRADRERGRTSTSSRSRIPTKVAYISQTTLSVDETRGDHQPAARALPGDRRPAHRRHLLRHHQPPGGGQAARPRVRPGAGDRLAQLVELQPPGRGRARARRRLVPDRQRDRRCASEWLEGKRVVGITSGASAPEELVQRLVEFFRDRGTTDVEELEVVQRGRALHAPQGDPPGDGGAARRRAEGPALRTLVVSDLHLGARTERDVLRAARPARARCSSALAAVDRLVLLGDVLELRHGPVREALAAAAPVLGELGAALGPGREVVIVPGNHDHHLLEAWLERRARDATRRRRSGSSRRSTGEPGEALATVAAAGSRPATRAGRLPGRVAARRRVRDARPLRRPPHDRADVRAARRRGDGADRARPAGGGPRRAEDYEAALAPIYAWIHAVAQSAGPDRRARHCTAPRPGPGGRCRARAQARPCAAAALAARVPGDRRGAQPRRARAAARRPVGRRVAARRAARARARSLRRLASRAAYVIFGHTHRAGPLPDDDPLGVAHARPAPSWSTPAAGSTSRRSSARRRRRAPTAPGSPCRSSDTGPPRADQPARRAWLDGAGDAGGSRQPRREADGVAA